MIENSHAVCNGCLFSGCRQLLVCQCTDHDCMSQLGPRGQVYIVHSVSEYSQLILQHHIHSICTIER